MTVVSNEGEQKNTFKSYISAHFKMQFRLHTYYKKMYLQRNDPRVRTRNLVNSANKHPTIKRAGSRRAQEPLSQPVGTFSFALIS